MAPVMVLMPSLMSPSPAIILVSFQPKTEETQEKRNTPGELFSTPFPPPPLLLPWQPASWPQLFVPSPHPASSTPPNISPEPQRPVSPSPEPVRGPFPCPGPPDQLQDQN